MNIKPGDELSLSRLKNPPPEFGAVYTWIWSSPITKAGVDERLEELLRIGVRSLYILPIPKDFNPENNRTFLEPEYLSREFFDIVEYALRRCVELGMEPWIYDEGGWPSGGACYNTVRDCPDACLKLLRREEVTLMEDKRFYPSDDGFIALFKGKRRLPDDYIAAAPVTLTAYYIERRIDRGNRIDYTCPEATEAFINNTYAAYRERLGDLFGSVIPAIFTDEPGLVWDSLAHNEFELFEQEYGYDLRDYLYVVEKKGELAVTREEKQARIDHVRLLGKLSRQNFYDKLRNFCDESGIFFSGHLDIDNRPYGGISKGYFSLMDCLRGFHIPGVDAIWEQIRYPYGGRAPVNDETLGMGFFPRLASSAARQEGRNLAVTETFSINGDSITPDEMRFIGNYQAVRGINVFNFMTAPYGKTRCLALGGRPAFCSEKPGFTALRHINEYFARLSYLLRLGYAEGDTALYLPSRDMASSADNLDAANAAFKEAGTALERLGIPFDIIDEGGVLDATDTGEGLELGSAVYRHIVVPSEEFMPESVRRKIEKYRTDSTPLYSFKHGSLRAMTRRLSKGRLWFVFNEGIEGVSEVLDISEGKKIYGIDLTDGSLYPCDKAEVNLTCGEMAVFLISDREYEATPQNTEYTVAMKRGEAVGYKRFVIEYNGLTNEYGPGEPAVDDDFSGEISYEYDYVLPEEPKPTDRYLIRAEGFSVTLWLRLGDDTVDLGMTPMRRIISGEILKKSDKIIVTAANTAANEIIAKNDLIISHPKAEVGPYHSRILVFEERKPKLMLGEIFIDKLS